MSLTEKLAKRIAPMILEDVPVAEDMQADLEKSLEQIFSIGLSVQKLILDEAVIVDMDNAKFQIDGLGDRVLGEMAKEVPEITKDRVLDALAYACALLTDISLIRTSDKEQPKVTIN